MSSFEIYSCKNFDDLYSKLKGLLDKHPSNWIYRGESSDRYELLPSLFRHEAFERMKCFHPHIKEEKFSISQERYRLEAFTVARFANIANQQGLYIPSLKELMVYEKNMASRTLMRKKHLPDQYYELFALAQHYGIPTRFLDWTYDMYVACFFAFRNAYKKITLTSNNSITQKDNVVIWAIDMRYLQKCYMKTQLYFVTPCYTNNPNLAAQKGVLSFYDNVDDIMSLDKKITTSFSRRKKPILCKFTLPYTEVALSFSRLYNIGYTYSRIFPGYASIAKEIEERNKLAKSRDLARK